MRKGPFDAIHVAKQDDVFLNGGSWETLLRRDGCHGQGEARGQRWGCCREGAVPSQNRALSRALPTQRGAEELCGMATGAFQAGKWGEAMLPLSLAEHKQGDMTFWVSRVGFLLPAAATHCLHHLSEKRKSADLVLQVSKSPTDNELPTSPGHWLILPTGKRGCRNSYPQPLAWPNELPVMGAQRCFDAQGGCTGCVSSPEDLVRASGP